MRNAKRSPSGEKKRMLDKNWKQGEEIESIGVYIGIYKVLLYFSPIDLKYKGINNNYRSMVMNIDCVNM